MDNHSAAEFVELIEKKQLYSQLSPEGTFGLRSQRH